jgi:hypothetical protein
VAGRGGKYEDECKLDELKVLCENDTSGGNSNADILDEDCFLGSLGSGESGGRNDEFTDPVGEAKLSEPSGGRFPEDNEILLCLFLLLVWLLYDERGGRYPGKEEVEEDVSRSR